MQKQHEKDHHNQQGIKSTSSSASGAAVLAPEPSAHPASLEGRKNGSSPPVPPAGAVPESREDGGANFEFGLCLATFALEPAARTDGPALSVREREVYGTCLQHIQRGLDAQIGMGFALLTIRDGKLYREEYENFAEFCAEKLANQRSRAYQLMGICGIAKSVLSHDDLPKPLNECQLRPLAGLTEDDAVAVWREAAKLAGEGAPTGALVKEAKHRMIQAGSLSVKPKPTAKRADCGCADSTLAFQIMDRGDLAYQDLLESIDGSERLVIMLSRARDLGFEWKSLKAALLRRLLEHNPVFSRLPEREAPLVVFLCAGMDEEEAAKAMKIAPGTVRCLLDGAFKRLGVSRSEEVFERLFGPAKNPD